MNPAPVQHRPRPTTAALTLSDDADVYPDAPRPSLPYAHLEPGDEGIWFAIACVACSLILYTAILLVR